MRILAFVILVALFGISEIYAQNQRGTDQDQRGTEVPAPAPREMPSQGMMGMGMMGQMNRMMENCNKMMESHLQQKQRQPPQNR